MRDTTFTSTPLFDCEPSIRHKYLTKLWVFLYPILNMWYWRQKSGSAYNLLDMDYDLVRALRDNSLVDKLSQQQCTELNSIREYKNPLYFKYLPPKPTVVELTQEARFSGMLTITYKYISTKIYKVKLFSSFIFVHFMLQRPKRPEISQAKHASQSSLLALATVANQPSRDTSSLGRGSWMTVSSVSIAVQLPKWER